MKWPRLHEGFHVLGIDSVRSCGRDIGRYESFLTRVDLPAVDMITAMNFHIIAYTTPHGSFSGNKSQSSTWLDRRVFVIRLPS